MQTAGRLMKLLVSLLLVGQSFKAPRILVVVLGVAVIVFGCCQVRTSPQTLPLCGESFGSQSHAGLVACGSPPQEHCSSTWA